MGTVLRPIGAIIAGMLVAFVLVIAVELFSAVVHPLPPDFGHTEAEMCQHVERYPAWVLAVVVPMWAGAALAGTWVAGRLGNRASALVVGVLLFAAVAFNLSMLPYPIWFKGGCLIAIPLAVVAGLYLISRRSIASLSIAE
jgi:hypothetical protein